MEGEAALGRLLLGTVLTLGLDDRLKPAHVFEGIAGLGGGRQQGAMIVAQDLQPRSDVRRVILPNGGDQSDFRHRESGTNFGDKFFHGIAMIAPPNAPEVTVETALTLRPMGRLMRAHREIMLRCLKRVAVRKLYAVLTWNIDGAAATMRYLSRDSLEESQAIGVALPILLLWRCNWLGRQSKLRGQVVDLLAIEDRV